LASPYPEARARIKGIGLIEICQIDTKAGIPLQCYSIPIKEVKFVSKDHAG
jgi:hypothetical protein